ncbi:hypothetical protein [Streptomyces sp. NPDC048428]|uniref:hypothetical protein n=1 Tax=Streptomyces sp. NPDC048428 TaxID=3154503 RepID=UPI00343B2579
MNPDRPSRAPMPATASRASRARISRMAALAAGATLGLGALAVPLATASSGGTPTGSALALVADTTAPTVVLGAATVKPGGEVPFTASGFPAGATLSVKFDDKTLLGQFPVGDDGSVAGAVTVPTDAAVGGEHWLRFLAPQTSVRSENLSVTADAPSPTPTPTPKPTPKPTATATPPTAQPTVRLSGSEATAGGKVSFTLSGFVKGQSVTVKLDDSEIIGQWPGSVSAAGTFSGTVTLPKSTPSGAHWLRFLAPNPSTSLRADFSVKAAGTGGTGSTGGSGTGGGSGGTTDTSGTTGGSGTVGGSGTTGGSGGSAAASASITAGSQVAAGGKVSFRVTGFPAGEQLTVKLDDSEIIGQWPDGIGADGTLSGTVTIPASATKGAHWLRFLAPNPSTSVRADFTVTTGTSADSSATGGTNASGAAATPVPAASGAPAAASNSRGAKAEITAGQVQAGGTLHFAVTKFPAGRTVTVKLDDDAILGQWKTDAKGSYEGDVTVPAGTSTGAHWLRFLAPEPATTLKVDFEVTGADGTPGSAPASGGAAPDTAPLTTTAASLESSVSYATIAWSAAAAAVGGAAGAAGTTLFVVRRRRPTADQG